jgi:hypothetical protein
VRGAEGRETNLDAEITEELGCFAPNPSLFSARVGYGVVATFTSASIFVET